MKRNPLIRFIPFRLALLVAPLLAAWPQQSRAANQAWDGGTAGTGTAWYTLTNWVGDTGLPGITVNAIAGSGAPTDIATLSAGTNTGLGINMNTSGGLTLGAIDFGRTNTSALTIGNSGTTGGAGFIQLNGATLTSPNTLVRCTGTTANLTIAATAASGTVATTLRLGHVNGLFDVATGRTLTISAGIGEAAAGNGFTKTGLGTVVLSGANTYSGLTTVNDGVLQLRTPSAAGSGGIFLTNSDGAAVNNNDVLVTGGLTYANNITIENTTNQNARTRLQSTNTVNANANTWAGNITFKGPGQNQTIIADTAPLTIGGNFLQDGTTPTPSIFIRGVNAGTINGNILLGPAGQGLRLKGQEESEAE